MEEAATQPDLSKVNAQALHGRQALAQPYELLCKCAEVQIQPLTLSLGALSQEQFGLVCVLYVPRVLLAG